MSQLSIPLVIKCSRCGGEMTLESLSTTEPDADLTKLHELMHMLEKTALCQPCKRQREYYGRIGRLDDWMRGNV